MKNNDQLAELKKINKKNIKDSMDKTIGKITDREEEHQAEINKYDHVRRLQWIDILIIIAVSSCLFILAFAIGYGIDHKFFAKNTAYALTLIFFLEIFGAIVIGFFRNQKAAKYYNDKRRRYFPLYTQEEAIIKKTQKILFLSSIIVGIIGIILIFI